MGLYLCVFGGPDGDDELDGVDVGAYSDFGRFRSVVAQHLEPGGWGSRFPVLMLHPDSDGEWSPQESEALAAELATITEELGKLPPTGFPEGWQAQTAAHLGLQPQSLRDCFIDVDGELLLDRLADLVRLSVREGQPIAFQ